MDDSCVVCAESLEWVAYGPCGHREVCSTCVARLRFICQDRRCCICKSQSDFVFVTKAMGDYTNVINDFSALPSATREGRLGSYWYHEDTQAFFDDADHYRMIKAMCRLSCSVCDKMEGQPNDCPKRQQKFRNIEQLKGHLFHRHKLLMCSLCLEGRKVFICEQKLYTRAQLNQHIRAGDSEVDGSESERGGFRGHPLCEFCKTPFYGDNELYTHMSTEHYTCHICQRQHPGQYEYYRNYDDLEIHFGRDHYLCEDEACLAKKFIVFTTEAELKRHNAMEHGGHMSRSQRNAALQIPTSFRYRRGNNEQEHRRGRGRTFRRDYSDAQLSMAIQASLETANADAISHDAPLSSGVQNVIPGDTENMDSLVQSMESLAAPHSETSSRYLQALGQSSGRGPLEESSFPPLLVASSSSQQKSNQDSEGSLNNTMAARLRHQNRKAAQGLTSAINGPVVASNNSIHSWPAASSAAFNSSGPGVSNPSSSFLNMTQSTTGYGPTGGSARSWGSKNRIGHSSSAPNLTDTVSSKPSLSDFPPVSSAQNRKTPLSSQAVLHVEDVQTANKSLVEKMRAALEYDETRYSAFKEISGQYRQGTVDTMTYLGYVQQFGLWHLVPDLARLCPDSLKQKELVDIYNNMSSRTDGTQDNDRVSSQVNVKENRSSKKSKGKKSMPSEDSNSRNSLADDIISTVHKLQTGYHPSDQVEELSKDGYRTVKGKSKAIQQQESNSVNRVVAKEPVQIDSAIGEGSQNSRDGIGPSKQRKKTSKFHRVRLGDGSIGALLNLKNSDDAAVEGNLVAGEAPSTGAPPVRGAWRRGGSQKLFS